MNHSASIVKVHLAVEADIPGLLPLMHALAEFEQYDDIFAVTGDVLRERGFRHSPPDFHALVAESEGRIVGMAVFYIVAFTAEAVPALYVKELFVAPDARGQRIGEALMKAVAREAMTRRCGRVRWQVANWNEGGKRFYQRLGAQADPIWVNYSLSVEAVQALADRQDPPGFSTAD